MPAILDAYSHGSGGGASTLTFNHTIGNLGRNGLIIVAALGRESEGQTNPEEITGITYNGVAMTLVSNANGGESGYTMYELHGTNVPVAGTYSVVVTYSGTGTPNQAYGICASFRNVKNQTWEDKDFSVQTSGTISTTVTTLTKNALVVGMWGERTAASYTKDTDQTLIYERTDGQGLLILVYKTVVTPGNETFQISPSNSEQEGMVLAAFETVTPRGGLALFL